jgi:hypothetical protein
MNPVATSDAAFRGGACPTPEYTIAYTGNYTTSADANRLIEACRQLADTKGWLIEVERPYRDYAWLVALRRP